MSLAVKAMKEIATKYIYIFFNDILGMKCIFSNKVPKQLVNSRKIFNSWYTL